jgi:hypothetical protein
LTIFLVNCLVAFERSALWFHVAGMNFDMFNGPAPASHPQSAANAAASSSVDELARVFNSAIISTQAASARDFSSELYALVESPAYRSLLAAVKQFARTQGISEREAAEELIHAFRKLDRLWGNYILQEGVDRLKGSGL